MDDATGSTRGDGRTSARSGSPAELAAMLRAVELAARGAASASPNPVVGCVLLGPDGATVGEGWHERPGGRHAEVVALAAAGPAAAGATAVVTLEPCAHTGRTGPCTQALLDAGVARVVVAVRDPWAPAAGGVEALQAGGVEVVVGTGEDAAERVNEAWLTSVRLARPFVTWKYAAGLDGQVAAADGTSRWITSAAARADVHALRARVDAVVAGIGTVLADDPELTARPDGVPAERQPLRVVLDAAGRTPPGAKVLGDRCLLAVATDAEPAAAAEVLRLPRAAGRGIELVPLLAALHARDVRHVLVEGGPTVGGAFLDAGLVDRVVGYVAPVVLGSGRWPAARTATVTIAQAPRLRLDDVTMLGPDVRLTARPVRSTDRPGRPAAGAFQEGS